MFKDRNMKYISSIVFSQIANKMDFSLINKDNIDYENLIKETKYFNSEDRKSNWSDEIFIAHVKAHVIYGLEEYIPFMREIYKNKVLAIDRIKSYLESEDF